MVWPTPAGLRARRRGARPRLAHPGRRTLLAAQQGARLRPASSARPCRPSRTRAEIAGWFGGHRHGAPGRLARGDRESHHARRSPGSRKTGPTAAELARAKTKQEFQFVTALERIGGFGGKADRLNQYNTLPRRSRTSSSGTWRATGPPRPPSVQQAVAKCLDTPNRLLVRFRVEKSGRPERSPWTARRSRPAGTDRPFVAPDGRRRRSSPTAWTSSSSSGTELPKVAVTFVTRAGAVADPAGKAGSPHMTRRRSTWARPRARRSRSRTRSATSAWRSRRPRARERARLLRGAQAQPRSGDGDLLATSSGTPASRPPSSIGRRSATSTPSPSRRRTPTRWARACARCSPSGPTIPTAGRPRASLSTVKAITRDDLAAIPRQRAGGRAPRLSIFAGDVTLAEAHGARHEVLRLLDGRIRSGGHDPGRRPRRRREALRRGPPGRGADLRDAVPARRRSGSLRTTTRCRSPTRSSAGAGSGRG